jgi:signal transduction histidine kinase
MLWKKVSLRWRVLVIVLALVVAALAGGLFTLQYVNKTGAILTSMMDRDVTALQVAQELEAALVMHKGLVTYYVQDGDSRWLEELERYRGEFQRWLERARQSAHLEGEREVLERIASEYLFYVHARDQVLRLYGIGEREAAVQIHKEVREQFLVIRGLCEEYKRLHEQRIADSRREIQARAQFMSDLAMTTLPGVVLLGILLGYVLVNQVLEPIRRLAVGEDRSGDSPRSFPKDEVKALRRRFDSLMEDVDQTKTQLEKSKEHLAQSEKWAQVGKLAAGVAHSIRNPLTSLKMRLFSMERSLDLSDSQREDFDVISDEIRHIDNIVRNFLDFSRAPKPKMQRVSPSDVVDMALQLLRHRLETYNVRVEVARRKRLPEVWADPDQLKEVLVNILDNACEAMTGGGSVEISEEEGSEPPLGRVAVIRVSDDGPGVPESIQEKIFQPFFSTKEEGTGLGLSIATRIVEEHGGWLELWSQEGKGATFIITLPVKGEEGWARS